MAEPFLSEIRIMCFVFAPKGWALCNGQLLPINQNQALFSLLGTTFGGDGRVNFALPDLRGDARFTSAAATRSANEAASRRIRSRSRSCRLTRTSRSTQRRSGRPRARPAQCRVRRVRHRTSTPADNLIVAERRRTSSTTTWVASQAHLNMQPFLTLSFCIALQGIFPSPN